MIILYEYEEKNSMKWIPHIIRFIFTLALIYGSYTETGIWTALSLLGCWIAIELLTRSI